MAPCSRLALGSLDSSDTTPHGTNSGLGSSQSSGGQKSPGLHVEGTSNLAFWSLPLLLSIVFHLLPMTWWTWLYVDGLTLDKWEHFYILLLYSISDTTPWSYKKTIRSTPLVAMTKISWDAAMTVIHRFLCLFCCLRVKSNWMELEKWQKIEHFLTYLWRFLLFMTAVTALVFFSDIGGTKIRTIFAGENCSFAPLTTDEVIWFEFIWFDLVCHSNTESYATQY